MAHWLLHLHPCRPTLSEDATPEEQAIVQKHFDRLKRLTDEGTVILVGPTLDTPRLGVVVFEAPDEAAARRMLDDDPAVQAGLMTGEVRPFRVALLRG